MRRRQTETPYLMILFKSIVLESENVKLFAQDIRIECLITGSMDAGHVAPCSCFHQIKYDYLLGAFSLILCGSFNLSPSLKNALSASIVVNKLPPSRRRMLFVLRKVALLGLTGKGVPFTP